MIFSSTLFLVYFLPAFLIAYHVVGKQLKNWVLLLFSLLFYAWGAPEFVFILLGSCIINFYLVGQLNKSNEASKRRLLMISSVVLNLIFLLYYKYANFLIGNVNDFLGVLGFKGITWTKVVMPIGISFFTFQSLTYTIDVYRKVHAPLHRLRDFLNYILAFPQLIAGPIVRFNEVADQLEDRNPTADDRLIGLYLFCIGLGKKVLIANVLAKQANMVFDADFVNMSSGYAWVAILAYTFQIYFDFSGYSDMAIGLGKIIGFKFPENFNVPYISKNISEFWRRWHISLGNFMRDYLYIPLGGNRVASKRRLYFNLIVVFVLSGFWHGAAWNFILWGMFHGVFLILDRVFLVKLLTKLGKPISILFTFFIVMMGWVLFRLESVESVLHFYQKLFSFDHLLDVDVNEEFKWMFLFAVFFAFVAVFSFGKKWLDFTFNTTQYSLKAHAYGVVISVVLFVLSWSTLLSSDFNPFIYYRF